MWLSAEKLAEISALLAGVAILAGLLALTLKALRDQKENDI